MVDWRIGLTGIHRYSQFLHPVQNMDYFFVVTRISKCSCFPSSSTLDVVPPSTFIRLSFTFQYFVPNERKGVIMLNCDFGIWYQCYW